MTLATLSEAITWTRDRWQNQRPVPTRLHKRETEGVGLFYSPAFASALDGSVHAVASMTLTVSCYHPLLNRGQSIRDCPECIGTGVKEARQDRYLYPMSRALAKLSVVKPERKHPHPYYLVSSLATHGWKPMTTAAALGIPWDLAEPLLLMALRKLHARYEDRPVETRTSAAPWTSLSESQQRAITEGEAA